jgi:Gram-negative bacterial TonB protein C-terminal
MMVAFRKSYSRSWRSIHHYRFGSHHFAIGNLKLFFILAAVLLSPSAQAHGQNLPSTAQKGSPAQHQALHKVQLSPKVAETLLIHKEEPACQKDPDGVKVMATIVIAITIDKNGNVSRPRTLSGPMMLRPLALATVRKYRYKPYLVDNSPVEVETVVSIPIDCFFYTGQA